MPSKSFSNLEKRTPSKQSIWGLNSLLFFISDVRHGVGPLLSLYLHSDLKWGPSKIGSVLALTDFSSLISQLPAGLLVDASPFKRSLIAFSCLCMLGSCLLILAYSSFSALVVAQLIMGMAIAFISPTLGAITLGLFGRLNYPKRTSKNEMWNHTGNVLTALSIGVLSYLYGHQWIFYIVILFAIASLISLSFIRSSEIDNKTARELAEDSESGKPASPLPLQQLLKRKMILIFNFSFILYYASNAAQIALLGQVLANHYPQQDALFLSACMIIAECMMIATAFGMGLIVNRVGRKPLFLTAFLILPLRAILYTLTENPVFLLSIQLLDGLAAGIMGVIGTVINSDLAIGTGRFNFLQGFSSLCASFGAFLSNVIAGVVATYFGFNVSFLGLASVAIIGALFFSIYMPETRIDPLSIPQKKI